MRSVDGTEYEPVKVLKVIRRKKKTEVKEENKIKEKDDIKLGK
jgi:hypothetical protein